MHARGKPADGRLMAAACRHQPASHQKLTTSQTTHLPSASTHLLRSTEGRRAKQAEGNLWCGLAGTGAGGHHGRCRCRHRRRRRQQQCCNQQFDACHDHRSGKARCYVGEHSAGGRGDEGGKVHHRWVACRSDGRAWGEHSAPQTANSEIARADSALPVPIDPTKVPGRGPAKGSWHNPRCAPCAAAITQVTVRTMLW